jgi:hypothetical protein
MSEHHAACVEQRITSKGAIHDVHSVPKPTSSWAVTNGDRWLDDNFVRLPTDEQQLNTAHVGGAALIGASITATTGVCLPC